MPATTLIVGPNELACEELRDELLALIDEAQTKAAVAYKAERIDHGDIYTAAAEWIRGKLEGSL